MDADFILLDTNILSFILRNDTRAEKYAPFIEGRIPVISFVTVAEMYFGAYKGKWGARSFRELESFLRKYVVIEFNYQICREWGVIKAQLEEIGRPVEDDNDIWIAATARVTEIPLITHNPKHFINIPNLKLITVENT